MGGRLSGKKIDTWKIKLPSGVEVKAEIRLEEGYSGEAVFRGLAMGVDIRSGNLKSLRKELTEELGRQLDAEYSRRFLVTCWATSPAAGDGKRPKRGGDIPLDDETQIKLEVEEQEVARFSDGRVGYRAVSNTSRRGFLFNEPSLGRTDSPGDSTVDGATVLPVSPESIEAIENLHKAIRELGLELVYLMEERNKPELLKFAAGATVTITAGRPAGRAKKTKRK